MISYFINHDCATAYARSVQYVVFQHKLFYIIDKK